MTNFLIVLRNIMLAAILSWLGMEYAPSAPDHAPEEKPEGTVTVAFLP